MKTLLFISLVVLLLVGSCIIADAADAAPCPVQPATLVAVGGNLSICSDESVGIVLIEKDGIVGPPITLALLPGVVTPLPPQVACANVTLRASTRNAAGDSPWSAAAPTTFRPCAGPRLLP